MKLLPPETSPMTELTLIGSWATIHAHLVRLATPGTTLPRAGLRRAFELLCREGVILCTRADDERAFLVFERHTHIVLGRSGGRGDLDLSAQPRPGWVLLHHEMLSGEAG